MSNEEMFASKESALQVLSEIIAIPSVKSDPTPDAPFGEATVRALDYLLGIGKDMGFHTEMIDHKVGYIEWGDSGAITAILCHLDVVPAGEGWSADPFHLRRENGLLIGRGVVDDKGPAVAALFAMKRLKESGFTPCGRIRLILGLDEESGSLCMERYKETEEFPRHGFTPDASFPVIFAEKGILHIRVSGPGSSSIHVAAGERPNMVPAACRVTLPLSGTTYEVLGVPAHASTPHVGENADGLCLLEHLFRCSGNIVGRVAVRYCVNRLLEFIAKSGQLTDLRLNRCIVEIRVGNRHKETCQRLTVESLHSRGIRLAADDNLCYTFQNIREKILQIRC